MYHKDLKCKSCSFRNLIFYTTTMLDNSLDVWCTSNFEPKVMPEPNIFLGKGENIALC